MKLRVPTKQQRLISCNQQLEDEFTLLEYNIQVYCVLQLVLGLDGGARKVGAIKVTKADRMLLAKARATTPYTNVKPFTVEATVCSGADVKYKTLMETDSNCDYMQKLIKSLKLNDLMEARDGYQAFQVNEQSLYRLTPLFTHEMEQMTKTVENLQTAMKSLEGAFCCMFTNCYYSEEYQQFGFTAFYADVEKSIKEKELEKEFKAKHGIVDDD